MIRILSLFSIIVLASCSNSEVKYDLTIQQPFESIAPASDTLEVKPSEAQRLSIAGGSSIEIPAWAFVNANGDTVKEPVKLIYKEMKNAADIVASGIPMTVQDSGKTRQMESAGMFELAAFAGTTPVFLGKDKKLRVNMASPVEGDNYDLFYLEPSTAVASAGFMLQTNATPPPTNYRWKKLYSPSEVSKEKDKSAADIKPTGKKVAFAFNTTDYPETKMLENINWQLCDNEAEYDPESEENKDLKNIKWNKVELNESDFRPKKIKEVSGRHNYDGGFFNMGHAAIFQNENKIISMNWDGKIRSAHLPDKSRLYYRFDNDTYLIGDHFNNLSLLIMPSTIVKLVDNYSDYSILDDGKIAITNHSQLNSTLSLFSSTGKKLWSREIKSDGWLHNSIYSFKKENFLAVKNTDKIEIISFEGNLISELKINTGHLLSAIDNSNYLFIETEDSKVIAWDFKHGKTYMLDSSFEIDYFLAPVVVKNGKDFFYWDIPSNSYIDLHTTRTNGYVYPILTLNSGTSIFGNKLFDRSKKVLLNNLSDTELSDDGKFFISSELRDNRKSKVLKLYSQDGILIKDFIQYDPDIVWAELKKNILITYNANGQICYWNTTGQLIKRKAVPIKSRLEHWEEYEKGHSYIGGWGRNQTFFIMDSLGRKVPVPTCDNINDSLAKHVVCVNNKTILYSTFDKELPLSSYLAVLKVGDSTFYSYVTLSTSDLDKYYQYRNVVRKREQKESERQQEESALIRSFEISNMGIYNWDRIYKDEDALIVKLNLKGELPDKEYSNATLFHITGMNSTTVIKYNLKSMDSFAVKLEEPNKLMLVLGDGRTGIVEDSVFRSQNVDALKRSKVLTVQLQVKDKPKDRKELAAMLQ